MEIFKTSLKNLSKNKIHLILIGLAAIVFATVLIYAYVEYSETKISGDGIYKDGCASADDNCKSILEFPRDEGVHPSAKNEWWYFNGHVYDEEGKHYGLAVCFLGDGGFMIGVADEEKDEFYTSSIWGGLNLYGGLNASEDKLDISIGENWWKETGESTYKMRAEHGGAYLDLDMVSEKPPLIVGGDGLVPMGKGGDSYYYSQTKLSVNGKLNLDGKEKNISGIGWIDRQWGDWSYSGFDGWEWFSIKLDNNVEIQLFKFFDPETGESITPMLNIMYADNKQETIDSFQIESLDFWIDPISHNKFSHGWNIKIPEKDIELIVTPTVDNQLFHSELWEGSCTVTGKMGGQNVNGWSYTELTHTWKNEIPIQTTTCTDTDGSNNIYEKGTTCRPSTVHDGLFCKTDVCFSDTLREFYCSTESMTMVYKDIHCANGCVDGACARELEQPANQLGPYSVGTLWDSFIDDKWGEFKVKVYYPAVSSGDRSAPDKSNAPYPMVAFASGIFTGVEPYDCYGEHLASWGYAAILFTSPQVFSADYNQRVDGLTDCITYLLDRNDIEGDLLEGIIDKDKVGASGQSLGGTATVIATAQDKRIKASVSLSPKSMSGILDKSKLIKVPIQFQAGSDDRICPTNDSKLLYNEISGTPKEIVEITGGGHTGFSCMDVNIDGKCDAKEQIKIIKKYLISWFDYFLKGDDSSRTYIFGTEAQNDLDEGILSYLEYEEAPTEPVISDNTPPVLYKPGTINLDGKYRVEWSSTNEVDSYILEEKIKGNLLYKKIYQIDGNTTFMDFEKEVPQLFPKTYVYKVQDARTGFWSNKESIQVTSDDPYDLSRIIDMLGSYHYVNGRFRGDGYVQGIDFVISLPFFSVALDGKYGFNIITQDNLYMLEESEISIPKESFKIHYKNPLQIEWFNESEDRLGLLESTSVPGVYHLIAENPKDNITADIILTVDNPFWWDKHVKAIYIAGLDTEMQGKVTINDISYDVSGLCTFERWPKAMADLFVSAAQQSSDALAGFWHYEEMMWNEDYASLVWPCFAINEEGVISKEIICEDINNPLKCMPMVEGVTTIPNGYFGYLTNTITYKELENVEFEKSDGEIITLKIPTKWVIKSKGYKTDDAGYKGTLEYEGELLSPLLYKGAIHENDKKTGFLYDIPTKAEGTYTDHNGDIKRVSGKGIVQYGGLFDFAPILDYEYGGDEPEPEPEQPVCGNGICEIGETPENCPEDCKENKKLSADLDCDGNVNAGDMAILLNWWDKNSSGFTCCQSPDINSDGNVNAGDFAIMLSQWTML